MLSRNSSLVSIAACSLASATLFCACGKKDSASTKDDGSTAALASAVSVTSLSSLPDVSLLLKSDATKAAAALSLRGSSDASNGTPPEMRSLGEEQVETFLTGSIDDFIAEVEAARDTALAATGNDAKTKWDAVQAKVKTFRQAQTKCRVLEDTVRQVADLSEQTNSMCYMAKIGTKGAGILTYKSGEKLADGDFFKADPDKDVIRKIEFGKPSNLALDGDGGNGGEKEGDEGQQEIFFRIPKGNDAAYTVELNFCNPEDGALRSVEIITVDKDKGEMSFSHVGSETRGGRTFKQVASLVAALKQDAAGKVSFDSSKPRVVETKNEGGESSAEREASNLFNGRFTVSGDVLVSEMFQQGTQTFDGNSNSFTSKNVSATRFSGSKMKDVRVFEGAGRMSQTGAGSFGGSKQSFSDDQKVAFEYDEAATPRYKAVATNEYLVQVDKLFADKDKAGSVLSGTAPRAVDVSKLASAKVICKAAPSSIYTMGATPASGAAFMKVEASCRDGRGFSGENELCRSLQRREQDIMNALWQRKQSGH